MAAKQSAPMKPLSNITQTPARNMYGEVSVVHLIVAHWELVGSSCSVIVCGYLQRVPEICQKEITFKDISFKMQSCLHHAS